MSFWTQRVARDLKKDFDTAFADLIRSKVSDLEQCLDFEDLKVYIDELSADVADIEEELAREE